MATELAAFPPLHRPTGAPRAPSYERRRPEETVLHEVVREQLETFLCRARERDRPLPRFVERELRGYLECGILAHGFVRVHCDACGCDRLVAFSCKGRGFCPSCGGRRMGDTAAQLVDRVLPQVPIRQWVLSVPFALRYRLAYDARLASDVLGLFVRAVFASLRRRARSQWGARRGRCGAVTFVQRFGSAFNLNVHFHSLVLDGVYEDDPHGIRFLPLPPPEDAEVERVACQLARRLVRLLERRSLGPEADAAEADPLRAEQPLLAALYAASVAGRVATGPRAGRGVLRRGDRIDVEALPLLQDQRCASVGGVSLHANVAVPARDRRRLERLCRYVARPPLATERLPRMDDRRLLYGLKQRWRDGTMQIVFEPLELLEKLAALVPPPRFHLVRYHGILGPCASARDRVVPARGPDATEDRPPACPAHARQRARTTETPRARLIAPTGPTRPPPFDGRRRAAASWSEYVCPLPRRRPRPNRRGPGTSPGPSSCVACSRSTSSSVRAAVRECDCSRRFTHPRPRAQSWSASTYHRAPHLLLRPDPRRTRRSRRNRLRLRFTYRTLRRPAVE